jgi:hypothetical protein
LSDEPKKSKRGGARPGAGAKKKAPPAMLELDGRTKVARGIAGAVLHQAKSEKLWLALIRLECKRLGIKENGELTECKPTDSEGKEGAVEYGDYKGKFSIIPLTNLLRYLEDRHYGRPVDTVNHLHDKPIEVNARLSLGEGMKLAMQKAEERVRSRA